MLARHNAHGTFFVLGWIAERHPDLVREIADGGHEIASHGWDHARVTTLTPDVFADSVCRSKELLESITGREVLGFRAPSFSIVPGLEWPFELAEGEGAFYGPKIEFHLKDALGRSWQLGTIQADFTLPERFELSYVGEDSQQHRPVMLHRAVLGSVERFFAVLVEHVAGAFPTWLAPEQVAILTVSQKLDDYAKQLLAELRAAGIRAIADTSADKLGAKIRGARLMRIPYLAVVGQREAEQGGASVRSRDEDKDLGFVPTAGLIEKIQAESRPPSQRGGASG
jgi:threonyl-tRNA synthetase